MPEHMELLFSSVVPVISESQSVLINFLLETSHYELLRLQCEKLRPKKEICLSKLVAGYS